MKQTKPILVSLLLLIFFLGISCSTNSPDEDVVCTQEFRTIHVTIKDQNQTPLKLDNFKVVNMQNGQEITILLNTDEWESAQEFGAYPLVDDATLSANQERRVRFLGYLGNQEVINSIYTVKTDACHISLVAGELELTI